VLTTQSFAEDKRSLLLELANALRMVETYGRLLALQTRNLAAQPVDDVGVLRGQSHNHRRLWRRRRRRGRVHLSGLGVNRRHQRSFARIPIQRSWHYRTRFLRPASRLFKRMLDASVATVREFPDFPYRPFLYEKFPVHSRTVHSRTKNFPYIPVPSIPGPKISRTFPYRPFPNKISQTIPNQEIP
jgi:hypothetical protein